MTRKLTITLTEDEYRFVKEHGRGWTRRAVKELMAPKKPWWKFW